MKKLIDLLQQLTIEILLFVFNLCLLVLAIINNDDNRDNLREKLGEVMIMVNIIAPTISMVFIAAQILLVIREIYLERKQQKRRKFGQVTIQNRNRLRARDEISFSPQFSTNIQESESNQFDKRVDTLGWSQINRRNNQTLKTFHQTPNLIQESNVLLFLLCYS